MKMIGLLGGMSWPSTIDYYRILNELAQSRQGGHHSANLLLRSIDYHEIKSAYYGHWDRVPGLLETEVREFASLGAACLVLCNNTLHEALDEILPGLNLRMPVIHIARETGTEAVRHGIRRVLLLGTLHTMEHHYYRGTLESFGLEVQIPDAAERSRIQAIQNELARGNVLPNDRAWFTAMLTRYRQLDAAVLACTELPLLFPGDALETDPGLPLLNPTRIQCEAAMRFALSD